MSDIYDYRGEVRTARYISAGCGVAVLVALLLLGLSWKYDLAILLLSAGILAYYLRMVSTTVKEYLIDPSDEEVNWKLGVEVVSLGVPFRDFQRLCHVLLTADGPQGAIRESRVRRITRKHRVFMWLRLVFPLLLAVVLLGFSFSLATRGKLVIDTSIHLDQSAKTTTSTDNPIPSVKPVTPVSGPSVPAVSLPNSVSIQWWQPFLAGLFFGLVSWFIWLRWKYEYRMITDWNAYLITMPPVWLPFWQPNPLRMSYDEMDVVGVNNSFLGNTIGKLLGKGQTWGSVVLDSPSNHDRRFNNISGQPDHQEFMQDTESARRSYKLAVSGLR